MPKNKVTVFNQYPFTVGQKIKIESGPRKGDWQVIAVTDAKVTLRCPLSGREFEWHHFCFFAGDEDLDWPSNK